MPRRRSRYSTPGPRAGSVLLDTGRRGARRRRRRRRGGGGVGWGRLAARLLVVLAVVGAAAGGVYLWRSHENAQDARRNAAERFAAAWQGRDPAAMWRALSPRAQAITPERRFVTAYRNADRAAGVRAVKVGTLGPERDGRIALPVAVRTDIFGTLRGTISAAGVRDRRRRGRRLELRAPPAGPAQRRARRAARRTGAAARGAARRGRLAAGGHGDRERPAEALRRPARGPSLGAAAVRGAGRRPDARRRRAARSGPRSTRRCHGPRPPRSAARSAASR